MTDLFSDSDKSEIASNLLHLHDTFGRDIVVYKEAQKVIVSTDPNYNHLYNSAGSSTTSVKNVPVRKVFKARIRYSSDRSLEFYGEANSQVKVNRSDSGNDVRIKLKAEDYNYIKGAKRLELDGRMFHVDSDGRAHGLFDTVQFYTLFLRPIE